MRTARIIDIFINRSERRLATFYDNILFFRAVMKWAIDSYLSTQLPNYQLCVKFEKSNKESREVYLQALCNRKLSVYLVT